VDGVGRSALIRHDAGDFGDSIFSAGHTNRAFKETGWRRPPEQAREQKRFILEALQAVRRSALREDVLGRHFQMSKAQVLFQLLQLMKRNKKYWLLPVIIVLVLIGALLVATQSSALAPFIYSLF
jgi:hypothetical protein